MALYALAENCDYGNLRDKIIRDRIVVGIRDTGLSEHLQLDPDLNLEKAKKTVRQREAVHQQNQTLTEPDGAAAAPTSSIAALQPTKPSDSRDVQGTGVNHDILDLIATLRSTALDVEKSRIHTKIATDALCNKCSKKGHYGVMCRTKISVTSELHGSPDPSNVAFLDNLTPETSETVWHTHIDLCGRPTLFKLDTGAEVTATTHTKSWGSQHFSPLTGCYTALLECL